AITPSTTPRITPARETFFITFSVVYFAHHGQFHEFSCFRSRRPPEIDGPARAAELHLTAVLALPAAASSPLEGWGALSPINRALDSRSVMLMPERDSNNAGTCAAICAMSPVILLAPAVEPLPVETMVILSTLASGWAMARTTSGMLVI